MKANEIQIGDWLYSIIDRYDHVEKKLCKVTGIRTDCDAPLIQCDDTDVWYHLDSYEPVPLTPEVLEKNGFIYTTPHWSTLSEDKIWQLENSDIQVLVEIEAQTDDNLIEYYVGNFLRGANSCTLYFSYVHQLQHALRLCGIEKTIEL